MCTTERINSGFKYTDRCEQGNNLYMAMLEARQAYTHYQGKDESEAQQLYNRYDSAKTAYDRHVLESQGISTTFSNN